MTGCELFAEHYEHFALGILEGDERAAIQEHLDEGCPVCVEEIRKAANLAASLAWTVPQHTPRPALRRTLLQSIAAQHPKRRWFPAWMWAPVAAMIVLGLLLTREMREHRQDLAQVQAINRELAARNADYIRALAVLAAPGTISISLTAAGSAAPEVNAYWNEVAGLVLAGKHLPQLPVNRTYQLWVVPREGKPVSAGIFEPDMHGSALLIAQPLSKPAAAAALAITQEPAGGMAQPTSKPIWVGPLG